MKKLMLVAVALAGMASTGASAQSVLTQNIVFGPRTADVSGVTGLTTNGGVLPFFFFDSRVGTLNSITFATSYSFTSATIVSNRSTTMATGTAGIQSAAQFSADDTGITAALNRAVNTASTTGTTLSPAAYNLVGNQSSYSLAPGTSSLPLLSAASGSTSFTDTNAANLAAFTRTGTFSYNPLITTLTTVVGSNSGGSVTYAPLTTFTGTLTISYNITPLAGGGPTPGPGAVPEPASWAVMLLGFGAIGAVLRRRVRRSQEEFDAEIRRVTEGAAA